MRRLIFFGVVVLVWACAHYYVGSRLIRPWLSPLREKAAPDLVRRRRFAAWALVWLSFSLAPIVMVSSRLIGDGLGSIRWVGFFHMGIFVLLFVFVVFRDAALGAATLIAKLASRPADLARRNFLTRTSNAGILGVSGILSAWGYREAVRDPDVVEVDVPVPGLPPALDGYRIVQLSDVHIGPTIRGDYMRRIVAIANGLEADLAAVTGDLVDGHVEDLRDEVAPLAGLSARDGVFFCTGNHEYYWDADAWVAEVARLGLTPLQNEHRLIERDGAKLLVAGVTDFRSEREGGVPSDASAAKAGAPAHDFSLLLAHQPKSIFGAAAAGFDLQISGHTHGGQFFPITLFVGWAHPYTTGLHRHDDTFIYVNRGTGYWGPPLRNGVPSEITLLRLVRV